MYRCALSRTSCLLGPGPVCTPPFPAFALRGELVVFANPGCLATLKDILQPVVDQGADYLVLGCTHYPFLKIAIQSIFGQKLTLIDSGLAVARQTARILIKNELLFEQNHDGDVRIECYVSGNNAESLRPILQLLLEPELNWTISNISD